MSPPVDRLASRVLLLDAAGRVLLFRGNDPGDPAAGEWWFTPGGGRDEGESARNAAARELHEETGLLVDPSELGAVVHERETVFAFDGTTYRQSEQYFVLRVEAHDVQTHGFEPLEVASILEHRWWRPADLQGERYYPEELLDVLERLPAGAFR